MNVSNILNDYFVNITRSIGGEDDISEGESFDDMVNKDYSNDSMFYFKNNISQHNASFCFQTVTVDFMYDKLRGLNAKKACGYDSIPPKLVKVDTNVFCQPLTYIINQYLKTPSSPNVLKRSEVAPIFKRGETLDKRHHCPVSILPCTCNIFESIIIDQMQQLF